MEVFNVDKYEFNIKLEQIKKLAAKKEYKQAADIAWLRRRVWSVATRFMYPWPPFDSGR